MSKTTCSIEDGLGQFLRQEREARGILLDDVAKQTRVRNFYLGLIESSEYHRLPSIPIGRGFVRAYAVAIGVDADAAARRFDREFGTAQQQEKEAALSVEKIAFSQIAQQPAGQKLWLPFAAVVVLIVVSGVLFWFLMGKTERYVPVTSFSERLKAAAGPMMKQMPSLLNPARLEPAQPGNSERAVTPPPKPAAEPQGLKDLPTEENIVSVSAVKENGSASLPAPVAAPAAQTGESPALEAAASRPSLPSMALRDRLALKIRALEDTWVRIVVDQREIQEFLLTAGNERFWKGSEKFILTVGNAAGTQVSLNGANISLPQSSSNVVRDFVITEKLLN